MSGRARRQAQEATRTYAVLAGLVLVIVGQFVLLLASVQCYERGETALLLRATLASGLGLIAAVRMIRYLLPGPTSRA